jgi:hypothetical protein
MNRWRVGEDRGSKEMDRCPLTAAQSQPRDQLGDKGCQNVSLPTTMFNLQS